MRIGIDTRPLEGPRHGGVSEYINNLLPELFKAGREHSFLLFHNSFRPPRSSYLNLLRYSNVQMHRFHYPNRALFITGRFLKKPKIDKLLGDLDVLLCPHFFTSPVSKKCKKVTVFHDISFVKFPEFFDLNRRIWHKFLVSPKHQAKVSDSLVSVSHSTKDDLVNLYKIKQEKIKVIYPGLNKELLDSGGEGWSKIKIKYNLPQKYILTLSAIGPRKNTIGLMYAFDHMMENNDLGDTHLVIAGSFERRYKGKVKRLRKKLKHGKKIVFTGPIEQKEKSALYKNAQLFVWPSLYEGFGFPPLEAMYCGVPTIVSNTTSLPEITDGAALLVDPVRPRQISSAMSEVLADKRLYNKLLVQGRKRAEQFRWEKTAKEILSVLESSVL